MSFFSFIKRFFDRGGSAPPNVRMNPVERRRLNRELSDRYRRLADQADAEAGRSGDDPPRPGRKTYGQRRQETERMSTPEILELIEQRGGTRCGVAYRILAERYATEEAHPGDFRMD